MIPTPDTVVNKWTMMVKHFNTTTTNNTMKARF